MKTKITELLGIEYPIIQGGMAWVAEYHLAAAVSEAGGLGIIGGAGAVYANCIKRCECIAFEDLLSEGVFRLEVENFPAIVAYDCFGGKIY